jgi:hypothetical protein
MCPRGPADREGGEVDEAVPRRDEGRDVLEAVDVDPEPAGEDVLDDAGEHDHDRHLDAGVTGLATQQREQDEPGDEAEESLLRQRRGLVEQERRRRPHHDDARDQHPVIIARRRA